MSFPTTSWRRSRPTTDGSSSRSCGIRRRACGRPGSRSSCCASRAGSTSSPAHRGCPASPSRRRMSSRTSGASSSRTLAIGQSNETPLTPLASLFTPAVTEGIRSVYGVDFEAFGYADLAPPKTDPADEYPRSLLVAVGLVAERGERLGDLAVRAQSLLDGNRALRSEKKALRSDNKTLRSEYRALRAQPGIRSVVRRVYRKLSASR